MIDREPRTYMVEKNQKLYQGTEEHIRPRRVISAKEDVVLSAISIEANTSSHDKPSHHKPTIMQKDTHSPTPVVSNIGEETNKKIATDSTGTPSHPYQAWSQTTRSGRTIRVLTRLLEEC